jgi:hypothetical protein
MKANNLIDTKEKLVDKLVENTKMFFLQIDLALYLSSLIFFILYLNHIEIINMNDSILQFNYVLLAIGVSASFVVHILYENHKGEKYAKKK